jgi:hypothetical protein
MATVLSMPGVGTLVLVYFLAIVSFAGFESTVARLTRTAFGMTDNDNFLVFAFIGAMLLIAGGCYRPLAKRFAERSLLAAGVVLVLVGIGLLGHQPQDAQRLEVPGQRLGPASTQDDAVQRGFADQSAPPTASSAPDIRSRLACQSATRTSASHHARRKGPRPASRPWVRAIQLVPGRLNQDKYGIKGG